MPRRSAWNSCTGDTTPRLWYLEALDPATAIDSGALRPPFYNFQIDLATHLAFRLTEQAIHTGDIRVALQADAEIDADAAHVLVDTYPVNPLGPWPTREPRRRSDPRGSQSRWSNRTAR